MKDEDKLTTKDLVIKFDVTTGTVNNWRKGSTRLTPLPFYKCHTGERASVFFLREDVRKWKKENGIKNKRPI